MIAGVIGQGGRFGKSREARRDIGPPEVALAARATFQTTTATRPWQRKLWAFSS
jgi:hypothetical protein